MREGGGGGLVHEAQSTSVYAAVCNCVCVCAHVQPPIGVCIAEGDSLPGYV